MPHPLRSIRVGDQQPADLTMFGGFNDDLAKQATAIEATAIEQDPRAACAARERVPGPSGSP